ncbi:hypothetical protein BVZ28_13340 [Alcaligenes faecalis]|nr:hypothetical protein BVZ28_13340 [Alcaligenes faecalis]
MNSWELYLQASPQAQVELDKEQMVLSVLVHLAKQLIGARLPLQLKRRLRKSKNLDGPIKILSNLLNS